MPKSKNNKDHKKRLAKYKETKQKTMEVLKKKMIDEYIKMQQQKLSEQETHTSTEEVSSPEIEVGMEDSAIPAIDVDVDFDFDASGSTGTGTIG